MTPGCGDERPGEERMLRLTGEHGHRQDDAVSFLDAPASHGRGREAEEAVLTVVFRPGDVRRESSWRRSRWAALN